ncbi:EpsG family protein [Ligilactobacillus salivarius]
MNLNRYVLSLSIFFLFWMIYNLYGKSAVKVVGEKFNESSTGNKISMYACSILGLVPFVIISGSRTIFTGRDTEFYLNTANYARYLPYEYIVSRFPTIAINGHYQKVETGYILYNKIIVEIFKNPQMVFYISSMIIIVGFCKFIYDNCDNVFLGIYMFLCEGIFLNSLNTMRQAIAMAIVVNAFTALKKGKYLKAIIIILLASQFHQSAVIFFMVMFLYLIIKNIDQKYIFLIYIVPIIIPELLQLTLVLFPRYASYLVTSDLYTVKIGRILILWLMIIIMYIYNFKRISKDRDIVVYGAFFLVYVVLQLMSLKITGMQRISFYFEPFNVILICKLFAIKSKNNVDAVILCMFRVIIFCLVFMLYLNTASSLEFVNWR